MKKTLAVLMALTLLLCLSAPLYALADGSVVSSENAAPAVYAEPSDATVIATAVPAPVDVDPGGNYIDLTAIINAVFAFILAVIARYVVPWIKARTSTWQYELLGRITETLVESAEKKFGSGAGKDKLNYVISQLHQRGYTIDEDLIEHMVKYLPENVLKKDVSPND